MKPKRLFLQNTIYTMDLRSAHKSTETPPRRLRLSLTRSRVVEPPYGASRRRRSHFTCLISNPPSPIGKDWEDQGEEGPPSPIGKDWEDQGEEAPPSPIGKDWEDQGEEGVGANDMENEEEMMETPSIIIVAAEKEKDGAYGGLETVTDRKGGARSGKQKKRSVEEEWSSAIGQRVIEVEDTLFVAPVTESSVWGPATGPGPPPGEVTVTDVTLNSLTVTFREALASRGFFRLREWALEV